MGRKSALEQLKKAKKGEKIKYEVRNTSVGVRNSGYPTVCVWSFVFNPTQRVTA